MIPSKLGGRRVTEGKLTDTGEELIIGGDWKNRKEALRRLESDGRGPQLSKSTQLTWLPLGSLGFEVPVLMR